MGHMESLIRIAVAVAASEEVGYPQFVTAA
jgi:hypothetical protein